MSLVLAVRIFKRSKYSNMVSLLLFSSLFTGLMSAQISPNARRNNVVSVIRQEGNMEDRIIEIFNICKCVMFYQCDEDNFIVPEAELPYNTVTRSYSLRNINRLRCSNEYYYCCRNKNETLTPPTTSRPTVPPYMPPQTMRPVRRTWRLPSTTTTSTRRSPSTTTTSTIRCGVSDVFTNKVTDKFPWTVIIYKKKKLENIYTFKCGGSLIHRRVVMTGRKCAHTLTEEELVVAKGRDFPRQDVYLSVSKTIEHEHFHSGVVHNNIALLILESPIDDVLPICLPKPNENFDGKRCLAVGWNKDSSLQRKLTQVDLPIIDPQTCDNLLRKTSLNPEFQMHSSFLCAGGEEGKDTCKNDGGFPLMCEQSGGYVQAGIVSWGLECGKKDVPGLYTNVANLVPWIEEKMRAENILV